MILEEKNNNTKIELNNKMKIINDENQTTKIPKDQIKNTIQTKPDLSPSKQKSLEVKIRKETVLSFDELIYLSSRKKEIHLKYDLENNVNLISFSDRKIDISLNENLAKNYKIRFTCTQ